jgi:hypothetical protein
MRTSACSTLIALLGLALPVHAAPAPIVFDFEDGLQGWELHGTATRVQTQLLGGEWAIFGDGFDFFDEMTLISLETDLTEVVSISVDEFSVLGDGLSASLLEQGLSAIRLGEVRRTHGVITGMTFRGGVPAEQGANPDVWTFGVSHLVGFHEIAIVWSTVVCVPTCTVDPPIAAYFIDNITFHPVPEPCTLVLLAVSLAALVIGHRWIR